MARPKTNNNPFAIIQEVPSAWQGLTGSATDGFLTFQSPMWGVRAGFINLINTYFNRGLDTIEKIFPVYAPLGHGNNDPEAYIANVVRLTGIPRSQKLTTPEQWYKLGQAIVQVEEGSAWVPKDQFDEGFKRALEAKKIAIPTAAIAGGAALIIGVIVVLILIS